VIVMPTSLADERQLSLQLAAVNLHRDDFHGEWNSPSNPQLNE